MTAFKIITTFFLSLIIACDKKPEPVEMGRCEVIEYNGVEPNHWVCNHAGYSWECRRVTAYGGCIASDEYNCERGQRLSAER